MARDYLIRLLLPICAGLLCAAVSPLCAVGQQESGLSGLGAKEVETRLGPPDERRVTGDGRESWIYGRSVILFNNGKVTAWSNAGEMEGRQNLADVLIRDGADSSKYLWENPWTPRPGPQPRDILQELFTRMDQQDGAEKEH